MFKRIVFSSFLTLATALSFADVAGGEQPVPQAESSSSVALSSSAEVVSSSSEEPEGPKHREVPVRYWVNGDSVELDAIFVKIENDTVYLKKPTEAELRHIEHLTDKKAVALQESNGQEVEPVEDENEEVDLTKPAAEIIMTDAIKDSMAAQSDTTTVEAAPVDDGSDDDLETALQKEDKRVKMEEIAKMEQEIREREIQDSIAAAKKNPYIKIYRFALKRLYNLEDDVMIDLSLSNYFVPEKKVVEETIELYPPGNANLLVVSEPEACSLYVIHYS